MNTTLSKAVFVALLTVLGFATGVGYMHEPKHPAKNVIHEAVYSQDDVDFLMIDLEHVRREAEEAYNNMLMANQRVYFSKDNLRDKP